MEQHLFKYIHLLFLDSGNAEVLTEHDFSSSAHSLMHVHVHTRQSNNPYGNGFSSIYFDAEKSFWLCRGTRCRICDKLYSACAYEDTFICKPERSMSNLFDIFSGRRCHALVLGPMCGETL